MKNLKTVLSVVAVLLVFVLVLGLATRLLSPKYMTDLVEGSMISQYYRESGGHDVIFIGDCEVYANYSRKISTSQLNEAMLPEIENYPPPAWKGKYIKIKYITQLPSPSPSFAFFCNLPQYIRDPYKRFLENRLREHFNFNGVPIQIFLRQK